MSDYVRPSKRARMEESLVRSAAPDSAPFLASLADLPLIDLPLAVLEHLLLFLPVPSLTLLAATCSFLEQLIHGRCIPNLEFPFTPAFLREIAAATSIDKKPVLRIICHQARLPKLSSTAMVMGLAFTSLDRLRDLVLTPTWTHISTYTQRTKFESSCADLLEELGRRGGLQRLTQLRIPVSAAKNYLSRGGSNRPKPQPTKLIKLCLFACTKDDLVAAPRLCGFGRPTNLVIAVLPHVTIARKIKVVASTLSPFQDIEKLWIVGPCSLDFRLATPRLREVTTATWPRVAASPCTSSRLPADERRIHRSGSCGMEVRWAWGRCPLLTSYNGVTLEAQGREEVDDQGRLHVVRNEFGEDRKLWMAAAKVSFHADYRIKGGEKELKAWAKARWSGGKL